MKCPDCGAQLDKALLYCEKCGAEIQIVPEFDPKLEDTTLSTIQSMADGFFPEQDKTNKDTEQNIDQLHIENATEERALIKQEVAKKGRKMKLLLAYFAFLLVLIAILGGIFYHTKFVNSEEYRLKVARQASTDGDYEKAELYYEKLLSDYSDNPTYMSELAAVYHYDGEVVLCENLLLQVVKQPKATQEQIVSAYGTLISIYQNMDDYPSIHDLLIACNNQQVLDAYKDFLGDNPSFSLQSGTYAVPQQLKMTCNDNQTIYFTLDGTIPTTDSYEYKTSLFLSVGVYEIKAFAVEQNGVCSDVVSLSVTIAPEAPTTPDITPESGNYTEEQYITVNDIEEGGTIYYTIDGTKPGFNSLRYTAPILMPEGVSDFSFVRIGNNGTSSKVVYRHFVLNLPEGELDPATTDSMSDGLVAEGLSAEESSNDSSSSEEASVEDSAADGTSAVGTSVEESTAEGLATEVNVTEPEKLTNESAESIP